MNLFYYINNYIYNALPSSYFKKKYKQLKQFEKQVDQNILDDRLNYYFKVNTPFEIPEETIQIKDFKKTIGTGYFFDLKEFLHYFKKETKLCYHFGDETHINSHPTLFKARPIGEHNKNSILFKLNKRRHFKWVNDRQSFSEKKDMMVWRGTAYIEHRKNFIKSIYNHPRCDAGQTNKPKENTAWQKEFLSHEEQLKYKFILSIEGNDVATNLKWILSSNSICVMPKPKYETWFMEGRLKAGIHYVELTKEYDNIDQIIEYYKNKPKEAETIIRNANKYVQQFMNEKLEDLLCLKILEKYTQLNGQKNAIRF